MKIVFSTTARTDRREAESYYQAIAASLVQAFRRELHAAIQYISEYPTGAPLIAERTRAKVLRGFPYTVLYIVEGQTIFVLAVANQYRDPAHYDDRLR